MNINAMNKLESLLAGDTRPLFMAHCIAGFPTRAHSKQMALTLAKSGADIIELQIPFSDPMADGPTIASACKDALEQGMTVRECLRLTGEIVDQTCAPLLIMSYLNPIFRYGIEKFVRDAAHVGVSGLIIPDAPFDSEEGIRLLTACREYDLALIPVVSPGIPKERLEELRKNARGFVYCTSRQGITGANSSFATELKDYLDTIRALFQLPVGLGFGIRTQKDVAMAAEVADIIIAGSVFVDAIRGSRKGTPASRVKDAIQSITSSRKPSLP
jgi:tryptophan synthase alpha subunit